MNIVNIINTDKMKLRLIRLNEVFVKINDFKNTTWALILHPYLILSKQHNYLDLNTNVIIDIECEKCSLKVRLFNSESSFATP